MLATVESPPPFQNPQVQGLQRQLKRASYESLHAQIVRRDE